MEKSGPMVPGSPPPLPPSQIYRAFTVWHELLRVLIFAIFSTIRKKNSRKKLFPAKICYAKIYSTTEIIKITI